MRLQKRVFAAAIATLLAASCAKQSAERQESAPATEAIGGDSIVTADEKLDRGAADGEAPEESKAVPVAALVQSNNQFAIDLLKHVDSGNVAYSPYAISMAGLMLQTGAEGDTRDQLRAALRLQMDEGVIDSKVQTLRESIATKTNRGFDAGVKAQLWLANDIAVRGEWAQRTTSTFGMDIEAGDMSDADAVRARIDSTVAASTVNLVENITRGYSLENGKVAVTLAATPSGAWAVPFERARTKEAIFTNPDGSKGRRPVMVGQGRFAYWEDGTMQVVGLPYDDNATAVVVLPRDGTFDQAESGLSHHKVEFIFKALRNREVAVTLPKFEVRSSLDLRPILQSMGVTAAFADAAEFGPAMGADATSVDLFVHETVFGIDEDGTRAQARSVQSDKATAGAVQFEATRPFLVFVRDNSTGQILMVARVI